MYIHIQISTYTYTCISLSLYIYIYIYTYTYIYIYICIYIHTYTHMCVVVLGFAVRVPGALVAAMWPALAATCSGVSPSASLKSSSSRSGADLRVVVGFFGSA